MFRERGSVRLRVRVQPVFVAGLFGRLALVRIGCLVGTICGTPRFLAVIAAADEAAAASSEENPFATDDEKMDKDPNSIREWSDRTGSFKVEATFVRVENGTVVLNVRMERKSKFLSAD